MRSIRLAVSNAERCGQRGVANLLHSILERNREPSGRIGLPASFEKRNIAIGIKRIVASERRMNRGEGGKEIVSLLPGTAIQRTRRSLRPIGNIRRTARGRLQ